MAGQKQNIIMARRSQVLFATATAVVVIEKVGSHLWTESFGKPKFENLKKSASRRNHQAYPTIPGR